MEQISTVCVYCASSSMVDQIYIETAQKIGKALAQNGIGTIFGAGKSGLMGALAKGVIGQGGELIGIIPKFMHEEGWSNESVCKLEITDSMHERKERMAQLADAIIAMPGGCGTMEELLEIITWKQLGLFSGKIIILNTKGYYDPLIEMLERAISGKFMKDEHRSMWIVANSTEEAISAIKNSLTTTEIESKKIAEL